LQSLHYAAEGRMKFKFGKLPATMSEIAEWEYVPAWPWPTSLTDDELDNFRRSINPNLTILRAFWKGLDLVYMVRLPLASGDFDATGICDINGHRWIDSLDQT
jgi:hypothetical protein